MNLITEIKIPAFLVFQILAAIVFGFVLWRRRNSLNHSERIVFDVIFIYVMGGIICGRIFYILDHFSDFSQTSWSVYPFYYKPGAERVWFKQMPWVLVRFWEGDMSFSGMLWGGVFASLVSLWRVRLLNKSAQAIITALCLAQVIQILGFLLSANYYGKPTDLFIGVQYRSIDDVFRYPVQILEIISIVGILLAQKYVRKVTRGLGIIGVYLFLFAWIEIFASFIIEKDSVNIQAINLGYLLFAILGIVLFVFPFREKEIGTETGGGVAVAKGYTGIQYSGYRNYQASFTTFQKVPTSLIERLKKRVFGLRKKNKEEPVKGSSQRI